MTAVYPRHYLGEPTLSAIEQAKREVWTSLQASDPTRDWLKNGELRTCGEQAYGFSRGGRYRRRRPQQKSARNLVALPW